MIHNCDTPAESEQLVTLTLPGKRAQTFIMRDNFDGMMMWGEWFEKIFICRTLRAFRCAHPGLKKTAT